MTPPKEALEAAIHLVSDCVPDDLIEKPTYLALFEAAIPVAELEHQAMELLKNRPIASHLEIKWWKEINTLLAQLGALK